MSSYPFSRRVLDPPYGCYHKTNLLPHIRDGIYLDKVMENSRGEKWQISIEGNNLVVYGSANKNNLKRWIIGCKINDYEFLSKAIQGVCREESRDWNHTSLNNFPN